jgi:hypothetical protein
MIFCSESVSRDGIRSGPACTAEYSMQIGIRTVCSAHRHERREGQY